MEDYDHQSVQSGDGKLSRRSTASVQTLHQEEQQKTGLSLEISTNLWPKSERSCRAEELGTPELSKAKGANVAIIQTSAGIDLKELGGQLPKCF